MKKIKNFIRFAFISVIVLVLVVGVCRFLFRLFWNFDILNYASYVKVANYWEAGGVFNTFKDCSLGFCLLMLPLVWLFLSYKLYKYGLMKFLTMPIIKTYRHFSRPKNMDIEHVTIKNMGSKDRTLDEIIADRLKEKKEKTSVSHAAKDIRRQIAAKMEENENQ